jgi:hypothetical protein
MSITRFWSSGRFTQFADQRLERRNGLDRGDGASRLRSRGTVRVAVVIVASRQGNGRDDCPREEDPAPPQPLSAKSQSERRW